MVNKDYQMVPFPVTLNEP